MHHFLVVAAVVVHHGELRDLVLCRRPQHARRIHQVAVGLDVDRDAAEVAVGERGAHRGRRAVADAEAAGAADPVMVLGERPQAVLPVAHVARLGNDRPVEALDRVVGFHHQARGADRARVPAERGGLLGAAFLLGVRFASGLAALRDRIFA